jgi:hypothetical protein
MFHVAWRTSRESPPGNSRGPTAAAKFHILCNHPAAKPFCRQQGAQARTETMPQIAYGTVVHDGGWVDKVNGVFSATYPSHAAALTAAVAAAAKQGVPDHMQVIQYEDADGRWHTATACGSDRPTTAVKDADD